MAFFPERFGARTTTTMVAEVAELEKTPLTATWILDVFRMTSLFSRRVADEMKFRLRVRTTTTIRSWQRPDLLQIPVRIQISLLHRIAHPIPASRPWPCPSCPADQTSRPA